VRIDGGLDHLRAEVIAASLGKDRAIHRASDLTHPVREVLQAEAKTFPVDLGHGGLSNHRLELPDAAELLPLIAEVLPGRVAGGHGA
jgi:hypothetical protein